MTLKTQIANLKSRIPASVKLIAVSKTKPEKMIQEAYDAGLRSFGENKVQEMTAKQPHLPEDIEWHFIGHLQRNKVKALAPFVHMIHAVDSMRLLKEINKQAQKNNRVIKCLLQFHIAEEESKFGLDLEEAKDLINNEDFPELKNIEISGVMGMATFTDDETQVRKEFKMLKNTFDFLKKNYFQNDKNFIEISMGMTNDYNIAIEEGATMVRIGSAIFGERS